MVFRIFQSLDREARHVRQTARRIVVAVDRKRFGLCGQICELIAKPERQITPAIMFVFFEEFHNRRWINEFRLGWLYCGQDGGKNGDGDRRNELTANEYSVRLPPKQNPERFPGASVQ